MLMQPTRRQLLGGIAASSLLSASQFSTKAVAASATQVRTQLGWLKTVEFGGFWLAEQNGYYKEAGVEPVWIAGGPSIAATPPLVAGGQADLGIDQLLTVVDAASQGTDLVALAAVFQESPSGILSLPDKPIEKASDIIGKRIGVGGSAKPFIDALLQINGLPMDYTPVPVGFDPTPLLEGACDGFVCFVTNQPIALKLQGVPYVTATYSKLGMPGYADVLFGSRAFVDKNRSALVAYLEASLRGWQDYLSNPQKAVELTLSTYGKSLALDAAQQAEQAVAQVPLIKPASGGGLLSLSKELIAGKIYEGFKITGRKDLPDVEKLIDTSLLEEAQSKLK